TRPSHRRARLQPRPHPAGLFLSIALSPLSFSAASSCSWIQACTLALIFDSASVSVAPRHSPKSWPTGTPRPRAVRTTCALAANPNLPLTGGITFCDVNQKSNVGFPIFVLLPRLLPPPKRWLPGTDLSFSKSLIINGDPGRTRTCGHLLRRQVL